jgi:hypothetical protein
VARSEVGILSSAARASPSNHRWMAVIRRAANSDAPPSSASIPGGGRGLGSVHDAHFAKVRQGVMSGGCFEVKQATLTWEERTWTSA